MINKYHKLIRKIRLEKELSQEEISRKIGVSRSSYIAFEKGKTELSFPQMIKLADSLGISLQEVELGQKPEYEKYKQMILAYLRKAVSADGKMVKTKLAKMLYLADFAWFYNHLGSMSGMQYRCLKYGPVPDVYFRAIDELENDGQISIDYKNDVILISETATSQRNRLGKLSKEELRLIDKIAEKWKDKSTKEIVAFTHNQIPYKICSTDEIIPYELITQEDPEHVY